MNPSTQTNFMKILPSWYIGEHLNWTIPLMCNFKWHEIEYWCVLWRNEILKYEGQNGQNFGDES